jgi:putative Holliday junction resolvase
MTSVNLENCEPNRVNSCRGLVLQRNACIIAAGHNRRKQQLVTRGPEFVNFLKVLDTAIQNSLPPINQAPGRLVALDLGAKRVGVALSDELRLTARPLPLIERRSWKDLLRQVVAVIETYDARGLVIGLPLNMDDSRGPAAEEATRLAENFRRSLSVPVYLQDERLTSLEVAGSDGSKGDSYIDSESAALILRDFMTRPDPTAL